MACGVWEVVGLHGRRCYNFTMSSISISPGAWQYLEDAKESYSGYTGDIKFDIHWCLEKEETNLDDLLVERVARGDKCHGYGKTKYASVKASVYSSLLSAQYLCIKHKHRKPFIAETFDCLLEVFTEIKGIKPFVSDRSITKSGGHEHYLTLHRGYSSR